MNDLLNSDARLTNPEIQDRLKAQAAGFIDFVERIKSVKLRR